MRREEGKERGGRKGKRVESICDPLSENPAHPALYENRDKTGNRYIDV